jgi:dGTPase
MLDLVDEIAYNHHDVDDGLDSGLLDQNALGDAVPLFGKPMAEAEKRWPAGSVKQKRAEALRSMINALVSDLIRTTGENIGSAEVATSDEVRNAGRWLVGLSEKMAESNSVLKSYLRENLYSHQRIERMMDKARRILSALCERYLDNPRLLPVDSFLRIESEGLHRAVADYVAGMTDRYATLEYMRLFDPSVRV